jgi:hypothetical protein
MLPVEKGEANDPMIEEALYSITLELLLGLTGCSCVGKGRQPELEEPAL